MSEIWDYFKGLFQQAEQSSPSQPLIHEMIVRSPAEKEDYQYWIDTMVCHRLKDWLNEQFAVYQQRPTSIDRSIDFLDTPSSKGFVIHFHQTQYSNRDGQHLFDYLKERVLAQNYRTQISDLRTYQRTQIVETVQRHYVKPRSAQNEQGQFDQRYGNVMIELTFKNEQLYNLKFRATSYKDFQYTEALPFKELFNLVLN